MTDDVEVRITHAKTTQKAESEASLLYTSTPEKIKTTLYLLGAGRARIDPAKTESRPPWLIMEGQSMHDEIIRPKG